MLHVAYHKLKQYQVPQFINIEDKVVGPLTLKQFFYLLAGAAVGFICYLILQFALFIIVMIPVSILTLLLTFLTINGQPFAKIAYSALNFYMKPKLFIWRSIRHETKKAPAIGSRPDKTADKSGIAIPRPRESRLSDLAWSLDIKEKTKR
ncbi:MAG: hypothetical protein A3G49_03200 [Candidatus Sungbacteria bacterium RIFCSPLOWO2_12_FULL_41_11]|uniref:PrgI family protein n=1 Tax=Candidatus Sungbacteria bacterium RIFCSPLOWO2_12_FULL_41_11 TaxID=1802286 RepID=A0A1G2LTP1_9BACT|nr:MAG: hypothetical protein UV01_C0001G0142 [Parcubacteria group bacterium GW2011_GWA2_42_14]OGZ98071.1 MAG: hypothetical protein A3D41_05245 [Candidatus Sungbacteria bacterium RIFCSPHIGHO2_02_FULL_41_12b]OHA14219.1 MAG: hypothetical protein A3G49_03200 [Candidatus Sungbacteria bacterium RIFCSPLOWO2_12_FULL_41_11]